MVDLHTLGRPEGSSSNRKRRGRGPGSGLGKTAGRGQKGQGSRSGASVPARFEGGQMPLHRRIPKRGFTPINRLEYQVVNIGHLDRVEGDEVSVATLRAAGLIRSTRKMVKLLGEGEVDRSLNVSVHKISGSARAKIEAAGGSVSLIGSTGATS